MSKRNPTAPWDSPRSGASPGPKDELRPEPDAIEVEVELDLGRPARTPRSSPRPGEASAANGAPKAPPRSSGPPPSTDLSLAGEEAPAYSTQDSISFWSLQAADSGPRRPAIDEPLSGTDEVFDPATGWDFPAVSDGDLRVRPSAPTPDPASTSDPATTPSAVADLPDWGEPDFGGSDLDRVSDFGGGSEAGVGWSFDAAGPSFSDLPLPPSASAELPLPDLHGGERSDGPASGAPQLSSVARPGAPDVVFDPAPPDEEPPAVVFDNEGFFSVADVASPVSLQDDSGPAPAPASSLEESAEFEFEMDDDGPEELSEDDIYSQSALPAVPPELAILPVEEAVVRARELFADGDPELGMAVLEAARMRAPDDTRVETWLEFGERRLIAHHAPGARSDRVPLLLHPASKLLRVTAGDQASLIAAVDGVRDINQLRRALPQLPVVGFWKDVGKLLERGWLGWSDPTPPG